MWFDPAMSYIDWFLPSEVAPDRSALDRRRVLVQGSFAAAGVTLIFLANRFTLYPEFDFGHANMLLAFWFMASCPFAMKFTGRYDVAAHGLLTVMTLTVCTDAWLYGGLHSVGIVALFVIPLMATFFLGRQIGWGYSIVLLVALAAMYVEQGNAGPMPPAWMLDSMRVAAVVGILLFVQIFSGVYELESEAGAARLAAITDNLRDGIVAIDENGIVTTDNPALRRLLDLHDPVGRPYERVFDDVVCALIAETLEKGRLGEAEVSLAGGRVGAASANPILRDGIQRGAVLVFRDRTLEHEVDEMKNLFVSTVSHELRTPMTSVLGFAKLIRSKLSSTVFPAVPEDAKRAQKAIPRIAGNLDIIISEGERLTTMITDLLDIAKMEAGRMEWQKGPTDPGEVARRAVEATGGLFEDKDVRLRAAIGDRLPILHADEARLLQVLINFISNAAKFTEAGEVEVSAVANFQGVRFAVRDTGPGIPEDEREAIFDRFRQATANAGTKGTGLGLAICAEIATAHNGKVGVDSELGVGSTFWMELPTPPRSLVTRAP
ncbi:MAG: hypothetical protein EP330_19115 [Deltaproteobacteria bacterium]|nr:MAG: hypothetical protein EP330_19115 [Deltaproteobacteria bacterium]